MDTLGSLKNLPLSAAQSTQLLGGLATIVPEPVNALVSHYNIRPTVNIYATTQGRDLGAIAADIRKLIEEAKPELPRGMTVIMRGQVVTMESAFSQLFFGLPEESFGAVRALF
jgi:multidrug efflux pump subunit AcrB